MCAKFGFNSVIQFHEISICIFKLTTDSQFHPAPHNVELRERAIYLVRYNNQLTCGSSKKSPFVNKNKKYNNEP